MEPSRLPNQIQEHLDRLLQHSKKADDMADLTMGSRPVGQLTSDLGV